MMVTDAYATFRERRDTLIRIADDLLPALESLRIESRGTAVATVKERLLHEGFKMLVIGEFSTGKSTVINAMLRAEILPSFATETTAIINEIKWGPEPRAVLQRKDGETQEVPVTDLVSYVVVQDDPQNAVTDSPYSKAEIFWPLELCRNGVEMIDSPGLNATALREQITSDYLGRVDAVIFVQDCQRLAGANELRVIENQIRAAGHEDIFFVCNKVNLLRTDTDARLVREAGARKLGPLTKFGPRRIFYVDALGVLETRKAHAESPDGDPFLAFERDLAQFLTEDSGRVKLLHAAVELKTHARAANQSIPEQINLRRLEGVEFERRQAAAAEQLRLIEEERNGAVGRMNLHFRDIEQSVNDAALRVLSDIVEALPARAKSHVLENRVTLGISPKKAEAQGREATNEIGRVLDEYVESELVKWQDSTLKPMLDLRLAPMLADLEARTKTIFDDLHQVHLDLRYGTGFVPPDAEKPPSTLERAVSAGLGLLLIDVGAAGIGATFGFKGLLRSILPQLGVIVAGALLGLGPLVLIPVVALAAYQMFTKADMVNDELKKRVCAKMIEEMRKNMPDSAGGIARAVRAELDKVRDRWAAAIQVEIDAVRQQADAARADRDQGQTAIAATIATLNGFAASVDASAGALDDFIADVVIGYSPGSAQP
jgi:hypothetical protein